MMFDYIASIGFFSIILVIHFRNYYEYIIKINEIKSKDKHHMAELELCCAMMDQKHEIKLAEIKSEDQLMKNQYEFKLIEQNNNNKLNELKYNIQQMKQNIDHRLMIDELKYKIKLGEIKITENTLKKIVKL